MRALGCGERFFHLYALGFPVHFCLVAQVDGAVDEVALRSALDQLRVRYGALRVCIRDARGAGPAFYATERPIELRVQRVDADEHWPRLVEDELDRPFPAAPGPLMRVAALLRPGGASVVLTFHHAVADGMSGTRVLDALMRALAGETLDAVPSLPPIEEMLAELGVVRTGLSILSDAAAPAEVAKSGPPKLAARIAAIEWRTEETDSLIATCRARGATVHGAVCAAAARHLPAADGEVIRLHCPLDLSRLTRREIDDCGVYVGAGTVELTAPARATFWRDASAATGQMRAARSCSRIADMFDGLAAAFPPTATCDRIGQFFAAQSPSCGVASNLGALALPGRYGAHELRAVWGPAMLTNPPAHRQAIGLATFGGQLRMVHQSQQPIPGLLEAMRRTLLHQCG